MEFLRTRYRVKIRRLLRLISEGVFFVLLIPAIPWFVFRFEKLDFKIKMEAMDLGLTVEEYIQYIEEIERVATIREQRRFNRLNIFNWKKEGF
jgi:hypothetical protein